MENQEFTPYQNEPNDNRFAIQEKLPNSTPVLILGIFSIIGCCCYGVGLIFGIIGLVLAKKDKALYESNPSGYTGMNNVNTGRILCIIGLILSAIYAIILIYIYAIYGYENYMNYMLELQESMQRGI